MGYNQDKFQLRGKIINTRKAGKQAQSGFSRSWKRKCKSITLLPAPIACSPGRAAPLQAPSSSPRFPGQRRSCSPAQGTRSWPTASLLGRWRKRRAGQDLVSVVHDSWAEIEPRRRSWLLACLPLHPLPPTQAKRVPALAWAGEFSSQGPQAVLAPSQRGETLTRRSPSSPRAPAASQALQERFQPEDTRAERISQKQSSSSHPL